MNRHTEILDRALSLPKHDRLTIIRRQASRFGIHAYEAKGFPHLFNEFINVEPLAGGDGDAVGDFVEEVEFFDGDCVDLVEDVDGWDVDSE
jgi:hypothetical protein